MKNDDFKNEIKIKRPSQRILKMKVEYENGMIDKDMTDEDADEIIDIYDKETEYYKEKMKKLKKEFEDLKGEVKHMLNIEN